MPARTGGASCSSSGSGSSPKGSLWDEPDTAPSPQRLLALLALLNGMVAEEARFVIATHSPILLAFPSTTILGFDGGTIAVLTYDDVPNAALTRAFLADLAAYLRHP